MLNIEPEQVWKESCYLWVKDNRMKNEKGESMEFVNHRFLIDIYDDCSPVQVSRKASQVGFSTMAILKSLHAAAYKGYNQIYTLPTVGDVSNFVPPKVNLITQHNPILQELVKDKDTIYQKRVGGRFIYYRGTFSQKTEKEKMESGVGIMISSDLNVHDECDRSDQSVLQQYESRLDASIYKGRWYFSNPSNPHTLSQTLWEQSDQKHWFVKCEHCNFWQYLDFWKNIKGEKFVCSKCGGEISDNARRTGKWVQKYRNKDVSGYWISHLICPWKSAKEILAMEKKDKAYFYNFVLGLPYRGSDVFVDRDMILKCVETVPNKKEHVAMGVDQGVDKHYVLMNQQGIFRVGVTQDWQEIENLMQLYDVECAVFDGMPDITEPRKLRDKYLGKVWLSFFKREVKSANYVKWDLDSHTVYSDRTKVIQNAIDWFAQRKIRFQVDARELGEYINQWQALYKTIEKDQMGIQRDVWESGGNDHYAFATIYALLALSKITGGDTGVMKWGEQKLPYTGLAPDVSKLAEKSGFDTVFGQDIIN
jgi:hypothetical protein